jgi:hypothetical protein
MSVAKDRTRIGHDLAWGKRAPWERSSWSGTGAIRSLFRHCLPWRDLRSPESVSDLQR